MQVILFLMDLFRKKSPPFTSHRSSFQKNDQDRNLNTNDIFRKEIIFALNFLGSKIT
jgi:hypothetical protein